MTTNPDNLVIAAVPPSMVDLVWDRCIPEIERVAERSHGEITPESIRARLMTGQAMLITVSEGANIIAVNTVEVRTFESGKRALYFPTIGGSRMDEWSERFLAITRGIARDMNCTVLRGMSVRRINPRHDAWLRTLNKNKEECDQWRIVHTVVECDVNSVEEKE